MTPSYRYAAPGRINLIGEHTDYNGGFALPIAMPDPTVVTLRPDGSRVIEVRSDRFAGSVAIPVDTAPGEVSGWAAYVAGAVWALRDAAGAVPGGSMTVHAGVEPGAGLASSAALTCAVVGALAAATDTVVDRTAHARIAQRAENEYVGAPTGLLDQLASLFGRAGHAMLIDFDRITVEPVVFDTAAAGLGLLVVDSRTAHGHAGGEYAERRASCERAAAELGVGSLRDVADASLLETLSDPVAQRRARHVISENARVLDAVAALRRNDYRELGHLLSQSHRSMRDDFEITTPLLDLIAATAVSAGAWGARMTGGGFGGCVIALCPVDQVDTVGESIRKAAQTNGYECPAFSRAVAGPGAGQL